VVGGHRPMVMQVVIAPYEGSQPSYLAATGMPTTGRHRSLRGIATTAWETGSYRNLHVVIAPYEGSQRVTAAAAWLGGVDGRHRSLRWIATRWRVRGRSAGWRGCRHR